MPKKLLSPEAARDFLVRRFNNQHQNWLAGEGSWPLVVSLGAPTEKDIGEDAAGVRVWATAWQSRTGSGEVVFEERQFARLGRQRLPVSLNFESAATVASAVGQAKRWHMAAERHVQLVSRWSAFSQGKALAARFDVLADYSAEDFERLVTLLAWLEANPASNLYLRQIPVEGLDTKWIEKRTGLVAGLLRELRQVAGDSGDFHTLCGLRRPAHRVRIRLLCPALRAQVGGLDDVEASVHEIAALPIEPKSVVIVENLETGLALPDLPGTVAIMRLGNAVSALGSLPWLEGVKAVYWGDIDTHGFAILDRARRTLPQLQAALMDEDTLLAHRPLWAQEPTQCPHAPLEALHEPERAVYDGLRANTWGQKVRLEQERIGWDTALKTLLVSLEIARPGQLATPPSVGDVDGVNSNFLRQGAT